MQKSMHLELRTCHNVKIYDKIITWSLGTYFSEIVQKRALQGSVITVNVT